jgi:hypothetical protein
MQTATIERGWPRLRVLPSVTLSEQRDDPFSVDHSEAASHDTSVLAFLRLSTGRRRIVCNFVRSHPLVGGRGR